MNNSTLFALIESREIQAKICYSQLETFITHDIELTHFQIIERLENCRLYSFYLEKFIQNDLPALKNSQFSLDLFATQLSQFKLIQSLVRGCKVHNVKLTVKLIGQNNSVSSKLANAQMQSINLLQSSRVSIVKPSDLGYAA